MAADTIISRLQAQAKQNPNKPAYYVKSGGVWRATSWGEHVAEVRRAAKALIALGLGPKSAVSILGFNRPEWVVMDLAAMCVGGAPAGIYTTCSAPEVQYIIHHAESKIVLVDSIAQWEKVKAERSKLPLLKRVVLMRGVPAVDDVMVIGWEEFLAQGDKVEDEKLDALIASLEPKGLATFIYTSGTTGPPKGVMLSHENLAWTATCAVKLLGAGSDEDCSLSYLPLSHIAEQMFSIHGPSTMGSAIYFAESLDKVPDNLKEVQPTIFFGVPRIWEKFHAGITAKLGQATGVKAKLARWAMSVGRRANAERNAGREPAGLLALEYRLANKLVFSKVKPAVGLGRARICVSGAAPIAKEILEFFSGLDIVVREVYGQSEGTGPTSFNVTGKTKLGTVGPAIPGCEVKIAADGEICVRGPNVFLGYYKEPEATAETLVDGWLHSGDLGEFDKEGFLSITGRKKEIIITAGGKNIAPKNIEAALKNHPLISEAVVIGDRRKYLTALITLDADATKKVLDEKGANGTPAHELPEIEAQVRAAVDEVNKEFARVEQVKRFKILPVQFTIESGELTPTLKIKRKVVNEHFAKEIESMYEE